MDQANLTEIGIENLADHFALGWNSKKIWGNQSFDDLFQIDRIPLSWFLQRILSTHTLPPALKTNEYLASPELRESQTCQRQRTKIARRFQKLYYWNEKAKIMFSSCKKSSNTSSQGKVLLFSYVNHIDPATGELYRLHNIYRLLVERQDNSHKLRPFLLLASPSSETVWTYFQKRKKVMKYISEEHTIYQGINTEHKHQAEEIAQHLARQWQSIPVSKKQEMFPAPAWELLQAPLELYISYHFIYVLAMYYVHFKSLLAQQKVKAIVITSQNSIFERSLNAAASTLNLPTILIQHGTGMGSINPRLREPYSLAVFSPYYRQNLISLEVPANTIRPVGPIVFDDIAPFLSNHPRKIPPQPKILVLTVPMVEQNLCTAEEYFNFITKILRDLRPYAGKITLKLHPREQTLQKYQQLLAENSWTDIALFQKTTKAEFYQLMHEHDVILNFSSTSALEALMLKKVVVTILLPGFQNPFNRVLHDSKATLEIPIQKNIAEEIQRVLKNQKGLHSLVRNRSAFVRKMCGKVDGKAAERTLRLIYQLTHDNTTRDSITLNRSNSPATP